MKKNNPTLILQNAGPFRDRLKSICSEAGKTWVADDMKTSLGLLSRHSFRLLLLDWDLIKPELADFCRMLDIFQPQASRIALFTAPQLNEVVAAMKSGMTDVLWLKQNNSVLRERLTDSLAATQTMAIRHFHVSQLTQSLTDRAAAQKTSLFEARKEFSKTFLNQMMVRKKMRQFQLADLMNVATRTLHRYLTK